MPSVPVALLPILILAALSGLCSGCATGTGDAEHAAEDFYAAVAAKDGVRACGGLTTATAEQLEKDDGAPCSEAVLDLKLRGVRMAKSEVYVTSSRVRLEDGDSVFLDETSDGWKVSAAGCAPQPGEEAPYDCEAES